MRESLGRKRGKEKELEKLGPEEAVCAEIWNAELRVRLYFVYVF